MKTAHVFRRPKAGKDWYWAFAEEGAESSDEYLIDGPIFGPFESEFDAGKAAREAIIAPNLVVNVPLIPTARGYRALGLNAAVLTDRELAAVTAGLRALQIRRERGQISYTDMANLGLVASAADTLLPLDNDEIDALCERLNTGTK